MIYKIPQSNKKFSHPNSGDFFGNIKSSKNITFQFNGYIGLEKRTRLLWDSSTYTDITSTAGDSIKKFAYTNDGKIWVAGSKTLYYIDTSFNLVKDTSTGTPNLNALSGQTATDICSFNSSVGDNYICAVNWTSTLYYLKSGATTWSNMTLDNAYNEIMCVFENLQCLAVAGNNKVQLVTNAFVKDVVLTLPSNTRVVSMAWNNNRLYISSIDLYNDDGYIFEWDGLTTEANFAHKIKGYSPQAMTRYQDGVAFVTSNGQLIKLSNSMQELASFPIFYGVKHWNSNVNSNYTDYRVLHGGIYVEKDMIYIAVDSTYQEAYKDATDSYFQNDFLSGVWCYDPDVGLHHKYSVDGAIRTTTGAVTTANVNTTTNIITIPSSIVPDTGTPVFYDDASYGGGTKISPLKFNTRYFVIKVSGTTMKLATTYANALAGTAIDITTTGNNSQTFSFCPNNGYGGSFQIARAIFPLKEMTLVNVPETSKAVRMIIGSTIFKDTWSGSRYTGIHVVEYLQENRGYFLLPRLTTDMVLDNWQKLFIKLKPLVNADDKIIVKYRKYASTTVRNSISPITIAGTWVDSTSFTTTDVTGVSVGDEIEIVTGANSGLLAHVVSITGSGTYTITIDETAENIVAGNTFAFIADNWIKMYTMTSSTASNNDGYVEIPIPVRSSAIELKIELRGQDILIEELQVTSVDNKLAK